jgi:hypothetical protein
MRHLFVPRRSFVHERGVVLLQIAVLGLLAMPIATDAAPALFRHEFVGKDDLGERVHLADMDGDGHLDLVTLTIRGTVAISRGRGDGTFDRHRDRLVREALIPYRHAVGDVDQDGDLDVAVAGTGWRIVPNAGDGSLGAPKVLAKSWFGHDVRLADLNSDGRLDAVLADTFGHVRVWLSNGATPGDSADVGPLGPVFEVVEVTGDGLPDLVGIKNDRLLYRAGLGNVAFSDPVDVGPAGSSLFAEDLDGDGDEDLVTGTSIYLRGPSGFLLGDPLPEILHAAGDLTGDGHADLIALKAASIAVFRGNGDATFAPAFTLPSGSAPVDMAMGDLDGNGRLDLVAVHSGSRVAAIYLDHLFDDPVRLTRVMAPGTASDVVLADLNGDGFLDVVAAGPDSGLAVSYNGGAGDFSVIQRVPGSAGEHAPVVLDVDGDGHPDLATLRSTAGVCVVRRRLPSGGWGAPEVHAVTSAPADLAAGDFNGDGRLDLAASDSASGATVLLGDGTGGWVTVPYNAWGGARQIEVGDWNDDGALDLVRVGLPGGLVRLDLGAGDGSLGFYQPRPSVGLRGGGIAVGDLDHDGLLDQVTCMNDSMGAGSSNMRVHTNGMASVWRGDDLSCGGFAGATLADLDGDGHLDLATVNQRGNVVTVYRGNGDGTFEDGPAVGNLTEVIGHDGVDHGVGDGPTALAAGDVNGDGALDLVVAESRAGTIAVLLNVGSATTGVELGGPPRTLSAVSLGVPWPHPASAASMLSGTFTSEGVARVELLDVRGRRVRDVAWPGAAGTRTLPMRWLDGVSPGVYFVRGCQRGCSSARRIVVLQ